MKTRHSRVLSIFLKALDSVKPGIALKQKIQYHNNHLSVVLPDGKEEKINLKEVENIYVVGCGKATAPMAEAVEEVLGPRLTTGVISVKYGHLPDVALEKIDLIEAGHPEPDVHGVKAASQALALLEKAREHDLVIALLSGGGSALWPLPVKGITLEEKIITTRIMLESGATIRETNAIRQHLSAIKGGKAAIAAYPAQTLVFMISDVEHDDPAVIASGPFTRVESSRTEILRVIERYKLASRLPKRVFQFLVKPSEKSGHKNRKALFSNITSCICSNNDKVIEAASLEANKAGYIVTTLGTIHFGDAQATAVNFVNTIKNIYQENPNDKHCIVAGGETTVILGQNYGNGGRNQEFALAAAIELNKSFRDLPCNVTILSCGTDGSDGPTNAAGALVNTETVSNAQASGLNPAQALADHNAYPFFDTIGALVKTGPTNTNVMDIQIAIIER